MGSAVSCTCSNDRATSALPDAESRLKYAPASPRPLSDHHNAPEHPDHHVDDHAATPPDAATHSDSAAAVPYVNTSSWYTEVGYDPYESRGGFEYDDVCSSSEEEDLEDLEEQEEEDVRARRPRRARRVQLVGDESVLVPTLLKRFFAQGNESVSWQVRDQESRTVPGVHPFFMSLCWDVLGDELDVVGVYSVTGGGDAGRLPVVLRREQFDALRQQAREGDVEAGNFGDVWLADLRATVDVVDPTHADGKVLRTVDKDERVFVKMQERNAQFIIEVGVLSTASDWALPTPRLVAVYQDLQSVPNVTALAIELSRGEPAHKWLAQPRAFDVKVRCAVMFAAVMHFLHTYKVIHSDVALRNFMTDGEQCFEIVDMGLAVIGDNDSDPAIGYPYMHKTIAVYQSSPEHQLHARVSTASDMWQFGFLLHAVFFGMGTNGDPQFFTGKAFPRPPARPVVDEGAGPDGFPVRVPVARLVEAQRAWRDLRTAFLQQEVAHVRDRLPRPDDGDEQLQTVFDVIQDCLHPEASERLSADGVVRRLGALLEHASPEEVEALAASKYAPQARLRLEVMESPLAGWLPSLESMLSDNVVRAVRSMLDNSTDTLELERCVGPAVLSVLCEALRHNTSVVRVDLAANDITDISELCTVLNFDRVKSLRLSNNGIEDINPLAKALREQADARLEEVHLRDTLISIDDRRAFFAEFGHRLDRLL